MEPYFYIIIIFAVLLALILPYVFLINRKKEETVNIDWLLSLLGENNIIKVEKVNKRIRITFKNLKLVDLEALKEKTKGIFIKGQEVVITFLNNEEEIYESLKKEVK